MILVAGVSCTSDDNDATDSAQESAAVATTAEDETTEQGSVASSPATTSVVTTSADEATRDSRLPADEEQNRKGEIIGSGSIGPPIDVPQPWPVGTVYTDLEPQTLIVDFVPPNPNCIAARASATIGRGGAILVGVSVESDRDDAPCPASADSNQIRIPLTEPLGDRRIYTSTVPATGGTSEAAERVADSIIGMEADEAVDLIGEEGFEVRDNTGADLVDSDFNPARINIWIADGVVDFAAVY